MTMTTLKNISGSSPRHFTLGKTGNRQIVQQKRHARKRIFLLPVILLASRSQSRSRTVRLGKLSGFPAQVASL